MITPVSNLHSRSKKKSLITDTGFPGVRRNNLLSLILTLFLNLLLILHYPSVAAGNIQEEFRAVKITNVASDVMFSDAKIAESMEYLESIGINTILLVVWNASSSDGVHTLYPSHVMSELFGSNRKIHPSFTGRDPILAFIVEAHARGMEVLPWFEYGFASYWTSSYQENPDYILKAKPHWGLRANDGKLAWKNNFYWMSAINPEVQTMIRDLTMEVSRKYDIDGLEYSDRIPAMPVEGGYDSVTVNIYKSEHDGQAPPADYNNAAWKRWRADKMNDWFREVRDSVKAYDANLSFSSSPSVYPWCYHEYLQDPYTWMNEEICDDVIPQLYRYSYSEYVSTLESSLQNYPNHRHAYFAGILMNVGSYIISEDYLMQAMQANRDRNVKGEAFFFYEGLRKNNNQLGDKLKATYYKNSAVPPFRQGKAWRPKTGIIHENSRQVTATAGWLSYTGDIPLHSGHCYYAPVNSMDTLTYYADLSENGWYNVYIYVNRQINATTEATYYLYHIDGIDTIRINQKNPGITGWNHAATVYLPEGLRQPVLKLVTQAVNGQYVFGDAVSFQINRHLTPEGDPVSVRDAKPLNVNDFTLLSTYPNPFNAHLNIHYQIPEKGAYSLTLLDINGKEADLIKWQFMDKGEYTIVYNCENLSSGLYFLVLNGPGIHQSRKVILQK